MGAGGLTDDEIRSAIADAEAAREADEKRKNLQVARNKAESLNLSNARMLREQASLASDDLIKKTKDLLERADMTLNKDDATLEDFEALSTDLSACSCEWHELVYAKEKEERERAEAEQRAQQQAQQPQDPSANTENPDPQA